jgi:N-methylhydantoinase A
VGLVKKLKAKRAGSAGRTQSVARPSSEVEVYFAGGEMERAALYVRDELEAGARLRSPAIVVEYSATTLIPPGASAIMDADGNLIIEP